MRARPGPVTAAGVVLLLSALGADQSPSGSIPAIVVPPGGRAVEQTAPGTKPAAAIVASFDGLGAGFTGPHGSALLRNPSDNSLAVGPNHIVQTVNTRMAIFTKKGSVFDTTGRPLYGPVPTNNVFRGFGGACESRNNGDAVVRYDQLADRWLIVMPVFSRGAERPDQPGPWKGADAAYVSPPGRPGQPGPAVPLFQPAAAPPSAQPDAGAQSRAAGRRDDSPSGPYSMCYAVSVGAD
ncbi:MAG TPA: hypothetical protein VH497_17335, partial [Vicinamibacterales bacterium]